MYTIGRGIYPSKGTMCFVFRKGDKYKTFRGSYDHYITAAINGDTLVNMYLFDMPNNCPFTRLLSIIKDNKVYDGRVLEIISPLKNVAEPIWADVSDEEGKILLDVLVEKKFIVSLY